MTPEEKLMLSAMINNKTINKMKAQLRIATQDQYCYIEPTVEGTPEEIVEAYHYFQKLISPQEGLETKEWNKALDSYLMNGSIDSDSYERMSPTQKGVIQEIKKSLKRQNYQLED